MTVPHVDTPRPDASTRFSDAPTSRAARVLAVLRIAAGSIFLWAFLDKTFGLGYAAPGERAWIVGGSPTRGFYAIVLAGLALTYAGHTWGLGRRWAELSLVRRNHWLR